MTVAELETKQKTDHDIYQTSTMLALLDGLYDGVVAFKELQKHGDFGLGTFDQLNGEMIAFDGEFYHLLPDGTAHRVKPEETTPFSTVTFFREDFTYTIDHPMHREELEALLLKLFPSRNLFYAFRMDGTFREVKTRTVPHQVKPYKPFIEATKSQPTFSFNDASGVITGFWTPAYAQGIGVVPGSICTLLTTIVPEAGMSLILLSTSAQSVFVKNPICTSSCPIHRII